MGIATHPSQKALHDSMPLIEETGPVRPAVEPTAREQKPTAGVLPHSASTSTAGAKKSSVLHFRGTRRCARTSKEDVLLRQMFEVLWRRNTALCFRRRSGDLNRRAP